MIDRMMSDQSSPKLKFSSPKAASHSPRRGRGERLDGVHEPRRVRNRRALRDGAELRDAGGDNLRVGAIMLRERRRRRRSVDEKHRAEHGDLFARRRRVFLRARNREVPVASRALQRPA